MKKKYVIKKSINNNISFSTNNKGEEIVICGKGISFGKKPGDEIDADKVDKVFALSSKKQIHEFNDLIDNIPLEFIELAAEIVSRFEKEFNLKINSTMVLTLSDHLCNAVENMKQGIVTPIDIESGIKRLYLKEYNLARDCLLLVEKQTGIRLKNSEAAYIVLHYINSIGKSNGDASERVYLANKIIDIISNYFDIVLDQETYAYDRFITHLTFFASRIFSSNDSDSIGDTFIYRLIKVQYQEISKCVDIIEQFIKEDYGKEISDEEKGYLIIHINNLLKSKKDY